MKTLLNGSVIQRGMLALVLAGSIAGAAGAATAGNASAAPPRSKTTCRQLRAMLDSYDVNSFEFRVLSTIDCTGSWGY